MRIRTWIALFLGCGVGVTARIAWERGREPALMALRTWLVDTVPSTTIAPQLLPTSVQSVPPPTFNLPGTSRTDPLQLADLRFRWIPAGTFEMGSPVDEPGHSSDESQKMVNVDLPFYMLVTEVTRAQFARVLPINQRASGPSELPATRVTVAEASEFCRTLEVEFPAFQFRLPTEIEWEYAARAGLTAPFPVATEDATRLMIALGKAKAGDEQFLHRFLRKYVCFSDSQPRTVSSLRENAWGLHDMGGNVWEWCLPEHHSTFALYPLRGGAWSSPQPWACRVAARCEEEPDVQKDSIGFRIVALPR